MTKQIAKPHNPFLSPFFNNDDFMGIITPIERVMDEFFKSEVPDFVVKMGPDFFRKTSYPKSDVIESNDWVKIEMDVPGLTKDQISIELADVNDKLCLVVSGEARTEHKTTDDVNYVYRELKKSAFKKNFIVDENTFDLDKIDAQFENGVLTVTVPKKHPEQLVKKNKKIALR